MDLRFRHRRSLLAAGISSGPAALWLGWSGASHAQQPRSTPPRLVVVLLRGAVDGLSVVAPFSDPNYARLRPGIAIATPGEADGLIGLDARFGLHPALARLMPHWQAGRLGFVHASGSPDPTRSHFDAQDYLESATPGRKNTPDGWMNRLAAVLGEPARDGEVRALNLGPVMPRIYSGSAPIASVPQGDRATRTGALDVAALAQSFDRLYAADTQLAGPWRTLEDSRRAISAGLGAEPTGGTMAGDAVPGNARPAGNASGNAAIGGDPKADQGALAVRGLSLETWRLGTLMRRDPSMRLGFVAVGGWDTHANQGNGRGQLANRLQQLAEGLDALVRGLGERIDDTVIMVMSEFGRTARQNGNGGTDHGHGNVIWLLGGPVAGGRIHGEWPGLDDSALYQGRDLDVTTDFRQVIAAVLERHLRLDDRALGRVLPGFPATRAGLEVLRS